MIKLGVIGTGQISTEFVKAAAATGKYCLTAVYSRNIEQAERFGKPFKASYFETDIHQFMKSDAYTTLYIASPNSLHFDQAFMAVQAGKHIIVEKPAFSNEREMKQILSVAKEQGVMYFEAARHVHEENFKILKNKLKEIGKIRGADFTYMKYSSKYDQVLAGEEPNIFSLKYSGGALADLGVYLVYAAVDLFGVPRKASYTPQLIRTGVDGSGMILFRYDHFDLVMKVGKVTNSYLKSEIYGTAGTICLDQINDIHSIEIFDNNRQRKEQAAKEVSIHVMQHEAEAFAEMIMAPDSQENQIRYAYYTKLSKEVNRLLSEIRISAGILYPADR